MRNVLSRIATEGTVLVRRHVRPFRRAYLVRDDDYAGVLRVIERACQVWGGVGDLIVPVAADGSVSDLYRTLLLRSELDYLTVVVPDTESQAWQQRCRELGEAVRLPTGRGEEIPVLMIAGARDAGNLRTVTVTGTPAGDPWELVYSVMLGHLPHRPDEDLLAYSRARDDLQFSDVLTLERQTPESLGVDDLLARCRQVTPVGLSRMSLTPRPVRVGTNGVDDWLQEAGAAARDLGRNVYVLCEHKSVADAALLWNLRALHGWSHIAPIGLPVPRTPAGELDVAEAEARIETVARQPFWMTGAAPMMVLTSTTLPHEDLEAVGGRLPHRPVYALSPSDVLVPTPAPLARSSSMPLTFAAGRALTPTLTEDDREVLALVNTDQSVRVTVEVDRQPLPSSVPLRGGRWSMYPAYGGGGAIVSASATGVAEVQWPQTWTLLEAAAREHGLTVRESVPGQHAVALAELAGGAHGVRWLAHRGLLSLLYSTAASTSMSWFKARADRLARQVAAAQEDPDAAMSQFSELLADINVSHDAETSGAFDLSSLSKALGGKRSVAEAWLRWALQRRLVLRVVQLICDHCGFKVLRPVEQTGNAGCPRCGRTMVDPFALTSLTFRYRLAEPLRRSIDDDSVYHALIMRWLIAALANRPGYLVGAHPGVEFYRGKQQIGEADIALLMADGTIIPAEVKRHGRQLTEGEVDKVRSIADALQSPTVLLGAGDSSEDCPQALTHDRDDGTARVITSDYWLTPIPRPAIDGSGLPRWNRDNNHPPGTLEDHEEAFCSLIEDASARAFGTHDPVRDLF
ncbi:hypothetical protein [Streptomyces cinerochromogenes]|uniref:hypothetical protein n=1 Tax=Streptomyces cinerochromogenes TaxID=66422 RepID=UPI0033B0A3D7